MPRRWYSKAQSPSPLRKNQRESRGAVLLNFGNDLFAVTTSGIDLPAVTEPVR